MQSANHTLRQRVALLRWTLPAVLIALTIFYEFGPARWLQDNLHDPIDLEILLYGVLSPLLAFWVLTLIGRWLDKTDRAEKAARASDRHLAAIMSASADAILGLDPAGRIEAWNRGAELLFGYQADEMRGQPFFNLFGRGEAAEVEFRWLSVNVAKNGYVREHETTCRDASGHAVTVELTATFLSDETDQPLGMSVILRDVTERKRRDEEIRRLNASLSEQVAARTHELAKKVEELARANEALRKADQTRSEFVSLVSHQIRAPLTNIRGAAERMQTDCGAMINSTCSRMFIIMQQQADRLDALVRDVLSAARLEAGELVLHSEPISVLPVVQQVVEQTRARKTDRVFHLPLRPGLPLVFADRDRVAEVLSNLIDNADKYSPREQEILIDVQADQTEVTVAVRDHGRGLPQADVERVFDKFYRADSSDAQVAYGYGLGLYVCRRLIETQGGRIWAENAPDGGAIFYFTLPVVR
jgi:PAS domain S-box-containing protein